jgi:hypothetical protein
LYETNILPFICGAIEVVIARVVEQLPVQSLPTRITTKVVS